MFRNGPAVGRRRLTEQSHQLLRYSPLVICVLGLFSTAWLPSHQILSPQRSLPLLTVWSSILQCLHHFMFSYFWQKKSIVTLFTCLQYDVSSIGQKPCLFYLLFFQNQEHIGYLTNVCYMSVFDLPKSGDKQNRHCPCPHIASWWYTKNYVRRPLVL